MNGRFMVYGLALGAIIALALCGGCSDDVSGPISDNAQSSLHIHNCDNEAARLRSMEACVKDVGCTHSSSTYAYIEELRQDLKDNCGYPVNK